MNRLIYLCFVMTWFCTVPTAFGQPVKNTSQKAFQVNGNITSFKDSTIYIFYVSQSDTVVHRIKVSKTGAFTYSAPVPEPTQLFISTMGPGVNPWTGEFYSEINFWVEPGKTTEIYTDKFTNDIRYKGNRTQSEQNEFNLINIAVKKAQDDIKRLGENAKREGNFAVVKPTLDAKWDSIDNSQRDYILRFIQQNPSSYVSLSLIKGYMFFFKGVNREGELASAFNTLSEKIRSSPAANRTKEFLGLEGNLKIGNKAKEIVSKDSSGNIISLSSLNGKFVLINFWASWCGPCRDEIPALKDIYQKYTKQNFTILSISLDENREKWLSALVKETMPWYNVSDLKGFRSSSAEIYNVHAIPLNILIDPSGSIIAKNLNTHKLSEKLSTLFDK